MYTLSRGQIGQHIIVTFRLQVHYSLIGESIVGQSLMFVIIIADIFVVVGSHFINVTTGCSCCGGGPRKMNVLVSSIVFRGGGVGVVGGVSSHPHACKHKTNQLSSTQRRIRRKAVAGSETRLVPKKGHVFVFFLRNQGTLDVFIV
jgi:hypothetical protein